MQRTRAGVKVARDHGEGARLRLASDQYVERIDRDASPGKIRADSTGLSAVFDIERNHLEG